MLIDTHCHIQDSNYDFPSIDELIKRARNSSVDKIICIGTNLKNSREAVSIASRYDNIFAAIGVHPHDTKDGISGIVDLLEVNKSKIVAIGEIGLDYYYNNSSKDIQIRELEAQLQIAIDYNLPVSFHIREAFDDFWPIINNFSGIRGVLHSFTDSIDNLNKALKLGFYIGVNGISTFTKNSSQKDMFRNIPLDRVVFETDAPFLTPSPFRGKMNEPSMVSEIAKQYANMRGTSFAEMANLTTKNAEELFGI